MLFPAATCAPSRQGLIAGLHSSSGMLLLLEPFHRPVGLLEHDVIPFLPFYLAAPLLGHSHSCRAAHAAGGQPRSAVHRQQVPVVGLVAVHHHGAAEQVRRRSLRHRMHDAAASVLHWASASGQLI